MDWTKINWTKSDVEIAQETGRARSTIYQYRLKWGPKAQAKDHGVYKPFFLKTLRTMKLPNLLVTLGKEKISLDRLKRHKGDMEVTVAPGDFMEAWQQKGLDILYPATEISTLPPI